MNYKFLIKAVLSVLLLYYILHNVEFNEIITYIKKVNFGLLSFAFLLHFIGLLISSYRWKILLRAQKIKISIKYLINSYLVASFFNHFLPSTVGGDSVRTYDIWKSGENKEKALAVVLLDRFLGLLTLLLFAIISLIFSPDLSEKIPIIYLWIILLSIGAAVIIWLVASPPQNFFSNLENKNLGIISKIAGIIHKVDKAFTDFSNKKDKLLYASLLSIFLQVNVVFYYYLISESLGLNVYFIDYFLIVPLVIFITIIPVSVNGVGLREVALFLFLSPFGVLQSEAIAFAWLEYGMLLVLGIIGGIVYIIRK